MISSVFGVWKSSSTASLQLMSSCRGEDSYCFIIDGVQAVAWFGIGTDSAIDYDIRAAESKELRREKWGGGKSRPI